MFANQLLVGHQVSSDVHEIVEDEAGIGDVTGPKDRNVPCSRFFHDVLLMICDPADLLGQFRDG